MAAFRREFLVTLAAVGLILAAAGCAEAPLDPQKENKGKGDAIHVEPRPGRNERERLEEYERQRGNNPP